MKDIFVLSAYTAKLQVSAWFVPISMVIGIAINFVFGSELFFWMFFGLLCLDTLTGIMSSIKKGVALSSSRLRDMYFKWVSYGIVILIGATLDHCVGTIWIHAAALGWVAWSETVSILENCEVIIGRKIPFLGRIRRILDAAKTDE